MSDAAIATLVAGVVTIATMFVGFLTLWAKLKYGSDKADEAAKKAQIVESKLDDNTRTTQAVSDKTDTIVEQTNGVASLMKDRIEQLIVAIKELKDYTRESSHRVLDAINLMNLRIVTLGVLPKLKGNEGGET